jgi:hypothetical protein
MKADLRARNFSEAFVSCAGLGVPLVEAAGSPVVKAWAWSLARRKSDEACANEAVVFSGDRFDFFEAHRGGVIVAPILPSTPFRKRLRTRVSKFGGRRSPRGMPARVRMAAFVRKVAIQIKALRRSGLFGGVCVNQGSSPRARNATARRDAQPNGRSHAPAALNSRFSAG